MRELIWQPGLRPGRFLETGATFNDWPERWKFPADGKAGTKASPDEVSWHDPNHLPQVEADEGAEG